MNCISRHQPRHVPLLSTQNTSMLHRDAIEAPKKILSPEAINELLPDLILGNTKATQMDPIKAQKLSKSFVDLGLLVRSVQEFTSSGASVSMSKLHHKPRTLKSSGSMNRLTHNAVFTAHVRGAPNAPRALRAARTASHGVPAPVVRRRPQALKLRKDRRQAPTKEMRLDDMGNLRRKLEEYREQKKSGRYIHIFDTDSDDEDLEEE